jgi:hypothetical protein
LRVTGEDEILRCRSGLQDKGTQDDKVRALRMPLG